MRYVVRSHFKEREGRCEGVAPAGQCVHRKSLGPNNDLAADELAATEWS